MAMLSHTYGLEQATPFHPSNVNFTNDEIRKEKTTNYVSVSPYHADEITVPSGVLVILVACDSWLSAVRIIRAQFNYERIDQSSVLHSSKNRQELCFYI